MLTKSLKKFILTSLCLCLFFYSCSSTKDMSRNQKKEGHTELYSYPEKLEDVQNQNKRYKRVVIVGLNDFRGMHFPKQIELKPDSENRKRFIYSGGVAAAKSYIDILKSRFKNQVVIFDAGSFLNLRQNHKETVFYYNHLGVDFVNLGKNELNLETNYRNYPSYLNKILKPANFKVIASNIQDLKTGEKADWRFIQSSYIKEVNGVKVGVIGVNSQSSAHKNTSSKLNGLYFQNLAKTIILKANSLRKGGAQVVILLASHGLDCTSLLSHNLSLPKEKVNFDHHDISGCENTSNELVRTLSLLPPYKVDLVLSSGKDSKVVNKFYKVPVIQNFAGGEYISWAEIYYDKKHFRVDHEKTKIRQPIQLCHQFIEGNDDCFIEADDIKKDIIPAKFLDKKVSIGNLPSL